MSYDLLIKIKSFIPEAKVEDPFGDWYEGDNRSFEFNGSYRTNQEFRIIWATKTIDHTRQIGQTCRVNPGEPEVCGRASSSGLTLSDVTWYSDRVQFTATCSVSNPLVDEAPAIDYKIYVTAYKTGTVCVYGDHDGFPNYEIWKDTPTISPVPLYTFDHGDNDLSNLFPPMDVHVSNRCF